MHLSGYRIKGSSFLSVACCCKTRSSARLGVGPGASGSAVFGHGKGRPQVEREFSVAVAMLGLPGFVVLVVSDYAGELEGVRAGYRDYDCSGGCPECGAVAQLLDQRSRWVRDLPSGGRPVILVWIERVWRCPHGARPSRHGPKPARQSRRRRRCPSAPASSSAAALVRMPRSRPGLSGSRVKPQPKSLFIANFTEIFQRIARFDADPSNRARGAHRIRPVDVMPLAVGRGWMR